MARIKLTVAYDGTDFCGWQFQPRDRTVQGEIEKALGKMMANPPRVQGSGRTDSGVHAMGQIAHFDCPDDRAHIPWRKALNSLLPKDVRVLDSAIVDDEFHCRYSAKSKTYEYILWTTPEFYFPQRRRFVWPCGPVDVPKMEQAAQVLLGKHDFASFQNVGTMVKTSIRTITDISHHTGLTEHEMVWSFTATGFLKQMVRNIMGCLVACGRGKISVDDMKGILEAKDRGSAPPGAPPRGLSLISVRYE